MPEKREVAMTRREARDLKRQARLVETFQHASDHLGDESMRDLYTAFKFGTDPEHPEAIGLAGGIFVELNPNERFFFARMMHFNQRFGRDAVMMAFTHYEVLKELQAESQPSPEN